MYYKVWVSLSLWACFIETHTACTPPSLRGARPPSLFFFCMLSRSTLARLSVLHKLGFPQVAAGTIAAIQRREPSVMCASLQGDGGPIGGGAMCSSRRGDVLCAGAAEGGARVAGTRTPRPGRGRVQCGLLLLAALGAAGLVEDPDAPVHAGQPTAAWTGAHPSAEGTDHAGRHVTRLGRPRREACCPRRVVPR